MFKWFWTTFSLGAPDLIRVFGGNERRLLEFDSAETVIYIVSQGGQPYFLKSRPAKYISR